MRYHVTVNERRMYLSGIVHVRKRGKRFSNLFSLAEANKLKASRTKNLELSYSSGDGNSGIVRWEDGRTYAWACAHAGGWTRDGDTWRMGLRMRFGRSVGEGTRLRMEDLTMLGVVPVVFWIGLDTSQSLNAP